MKLMIENVSKKYRRDFWGLRSFTLELGQGVLGLLGPNGAGKSTLMRILATVTQATEGKVTWTGNGHAIDIAKQPDQTLPSSLPMATSSAPRVRAPRRTPPARHPPGPGGV